MVTSAHASRYKGKGTDKTLQTSLCEVRPGGVTQQVAWEGRHSGGGQTMQRTRLMLSGPQCGQPHTHTRMGGLRCCPSHTPSSVAQRCPCNRVGNSDQSTELTSEGLKPEPLVTSADQLRGPGKDEPPQEELTPRLRNFGNGVTPRWLVRSTLIQKVLRLALRKVLTCT